MTNNSRKQSFETGSTIGQWQRGNPVRRRRCNGIKSEHKKARLRIIDDDDIEAYLMTFEHHCGANGREDSD